MPIIIPKTIPAFSTLQERIFVMDTERATTQDIRPLEILICNLMPTKIETENQLLSLLANSPLQVRITLLATQSYIGKNTPQSHLDRFYKYFSEIAHKRFDGAIITGAPIEHLEFEEVQYWSELREIMDFLRSNVTSTMYLCWGAMAGLYHFHNIQKRALPSKCFGVFAHKKCSNSPLLAGLDDEVLMPHSRHSGIDEGALWRAKDLALLLAGEQSGATMLQDSKDVFILGHPEYGRDTLDKEYKRDQANGLDTAKPTGYYAPNGEIMFQWRSSASVIFSNWLNLVYQDTPFLL